MDTQAVVDLVTPYVRELLAGIVAALLLVVRARAQRWAAVEAATAVEHRSAASVEAGTSPTPGAAKLAIAVERTMQVLPLMARPLTRAAAVRLIERAVPAARERVASKLGSQP